MNRTIKVVESKHYRLLDGTTASIFSAYTPGAVIETRGWTYEVVDRFGTMTRGLGRMPETSLEAAHAFADAFAERRGYTHVGKG